MPAGHTLVTVTASVGISASLTGAGLTGLLASADQAAYAAKADGRNVVRGYAETSLPT